MHYKISIAFVLCFKQSWNSCVIKGQTWKSDDKFNGIQEGSNGCVNGVMLLMYVAWCCCELWEGEIIP
jgi:hypothetical protein